MAKRQEGLDGKVLVLCYAGFKQRRDRCPSSTRRQKRWSLARARCNRIADELDPDAMARTEAALTIRRSSQLINGLPVETYLRSCGLFLLAPLSLRVHLALKHQSGSTGTLQW